MQQILPALFTGAILLGAMTVAPADERVPLTAGQLDLVTAGAGFILLGRFPGTSGWEEIERQSPDAYPDRYVASRQAENHGDSLVAAGDIKAYKYQITGH